MPHKCPLHLVKHRSHCICAHSCRNIRQPWALQEKRYSICFLKSNIWRGYQEWYKTNYNVQYVSCGIILESTRYIFSIAVAKIYFVLGSITSRALSLLVSQITPSRDQSRHALSQRLCNDLSLSLSAYLNWSLTRWSSQAIMVASHHLERIFLQGQPFALALIVNSSNTALSPVRHQAIIWTIVDNLNQYTSIFMP